MQKLVWAGGLLLVFFGMTGVISGNTVITIVIVFIFVGIPIILIGDAIYDLKKWRKRNREKQDLREFIHMIFARAARIEAGTYYESRVQADYPETSFLTSDQVAQLNSLRQQLSPTEVSCYPGLKVNGTILNNYLPEAGLFTVHVTLSHGQPQDMIVMLSSLHAVKRLHHLVDIYKRTQFKYQVCGNILSSRTGLCYSVLWVTSMQFAGLQVPF
jgi:hypothetical protein